MPEAIEESENGAVSELNAYQQQQQPTPTAKRRMSRLRAEKLIAQAYRIPSLHDDRGNAKETMSPHQQYAATSRGSFQGSMSSSAGTAAARPRTVGRLPSRGALASPSVAHELYLQQSGVQFYVEDLAKKLQEQRPEQPAAFIASYFSGVMKGTHVCGRAFEFVSGTMQNRLAFLTQLQKTFASVDAHMQLTLDDFTELVWCQCRDFPAQMLQQATHHLKESDDGQVRATLKAFMSAFSACFLYNEFLSRAYDIYGEMQASKDSRVVSPRGSSSVRSESIANAMAADRVVARLRVIAQQNTFSIPPMLEIEAVVYKSANFKEFCARFYESPAIASSIFDLRSAFQTLGCGSGAK